MLSLSSLEKSTRRRRVCPQQRAILKLDRYSAWL
jgi:hypothetical protein